MHLGGFSWEATSSVDRGASRRHSKHEPTSSCNCCGCSSQLRAPNLQHKRETYTIIDQDLRKLMIYCLSGRFCFVWVGSLGCGSVSALALLQPGLFWLGPSTPSLTFWTFWCRLLNAMCCEHNDRLLEVTHDFGSEDAKFCEQVREQVLRRLGLPQLLSEAQ